MSQLVDGRRNLARQVVMRQIETVQPKKRWDGSGKLPGELIVRKKKQLQSSEVREIGNRTGEAVSLETQNSKLSERCERLETSLQVETLEDETRHSVLNTGNAVPAARINRNVPIGELVRSVGAFLEGRQSSQIRTRRNMEEKEESQSKMQANEGRLRHGCSATAREKAKERGAAY